MALIRGGALTGGTGERVVADLLGAQVLAPGIDEASLGSGGSLLVAQGRRTGPVAGTAILPDGRLLMLTLAAVAVLLTAMKVNPSARPARPAPRGPPAL